MKPFLLLSIRAEDAAADDEYEAFVRFTGLRPSELHRHRLEREPFDVARAANYAGIFVGGGPYNVSDTIKSADQQRAEADLDRLLDVVLAQHVPFFGACYGLGVLGRHQGGTVDHAYGEPIGAVPVSLTAEGREDPVFGGLSATVDAFVGHKEAISVPPPNAVVLATSPSCPVQALRFGRCAYATQFHPELDGEGLVLRIDTYRGAGYFEPSQADSLMTMARSSVVTEPPQVLRRFVALARQLNPG